MDSTSDLEKAEEDAIEEVVMPPESGGVSRNGSHSDESTASRQAPQAKKIIRFKDGDPDNPDNWRQV